MLVGNDHPYFAGLRFQECCRNALDSSLKFVSKISGVPEEELKNFYKSSCNDPMSFGGDDELPEEDELNEEDKNQADNANESNECLNFIQALQTEAEAANMHDLKGDNFNAAEEDPEMANMPDREDMEKLVGKSSANQIDATAANTLPSTLRDVLACPGDFFNAIFRLAVKLRSAKGAADTGFLPNAQNCRRAARGLNWHQCLGCLWVCPCVVLLFLFCVFNVFDATPYIEESLFVSKLLYSTFV